MKIFIVFEGYRSGDYLDGSIIAVIKENDLQKYKDEFNTDEYEYIEFSLTDEK